VSPFGTKRSNWIGPTMSAPWGRPEAADMGQTDAIDPERTSVSRNALRMHKVMFSCVHVPLEGGGRSMRA
jgi:hypothetical protein